MRGKGYKNWRLITGVAAVGVLAFGWGLQGAPVPVDDGGAVRDTTVAATGAEASPVESTDLQMTGTAVSGSSVPFGLADFTPTAPAQGGVAGGPGTPCVCDSDCDVDGNACTADTCDLVSGVCVQAPANAGTACNPGGGGLDGLFCTAGECNATGVCLDNDLGGSPCDAATETCNDTTDRCDGNSCTVDSQCAGGTADAALCQTNVCTAGNCRVATACATGEECCRAGDDCDVVGGTTPGTCISELQGRCCDAAGLCSNTTLAACTGPWRIQGDVDPADPSCLCPKYSQGIADNGSVVHPFELFASESCTVEGLPGAAIFNRIGDDYTTSNGQFLALETFRFRGGVVGDGDGTIVFEFWDPAVDPPLLVDAFAIQFGADQSGIFEWTITLGAPIVIPGTGWVTLRPGIASGETVIWVSSNDDGATKVGSNNVNLLWVDDERRSVLGLGNDILSMELVGGKVDPTGSCCQGQGACSDLVTGDANLALPWFCADIGGTFVAGATCASAPCAVATCCFGDGSCSVLDPGTCTGQGGTPDVFGGTCSPNCCGQPFSSGETCGTEATVKMIDTLAAGIGVPVAARFSGDTSAATAGHCEITTAQTCNVFVPSGGPEPDSCPTGEVCIVDEACLNNDTDAGHWEAFTITAASDVRIGFCCSDDADNGTPGVRWVIVVDDCAACTNVFREGQVNCPDGNIGDNYLLEAGTYHYSVYTQRVCENTTTACQIDSDCVDEQGSPPCLEQTGTYELEIEATQLPFVACCFGNICSDENSPVPVTTLECAAQGGFELADVADCFGNPCSAGACCTGPGQCSDVLVIGDCDAVGGSFIGGAACATDNPCPICTLDDIDNGGPDCQATDTGWLLPSDRAFDPITAWADDFVSLTGGPMTTLCFEAAYWFFGQNPLNCCGGGADQPADSWNITVYECSNQGIPGAVIGPLGGQILQNVISEPVDAGACFQTKSGSGLTGINLVAGECYFLEILGLGQGDVGDPPAPGCSTGVNASTQGNNYVLQGLPGAYTLDDINTDIGGDPVADLAFCIEGAMDVPPNRDSACCFDPSGPPPFCTVMSTADCLALGGLYTPNSPVCLPDTCPAPCEAETCLDQISLNSPGEVCAGGLPCVRPFTNAFCGPANSGTGCPGSLGADMWFTYKTGSAECGPLTIAGTCPGYDGEMAIYDGGPNCDCPVDPTSPLACNDDGTCGGGSMPDVTFTALADTCYIIRIGGWHASQGASELNLSIVPDAVCGPTAAAPVFADPAISLSGGTAACGSDADCASPTTSVCRNGGCYARKGRFVSVSPNPANAGASVALRVCVDAPGPGAHCRWVGAPAAGVTHIGPGPQPVLIADLQLVATGTAVYRDWSLDGPDDAGNTVVHIGGCAVSNGHDYYIQAILSGSDEANEASYSPALILPTTGDVHGPPPTGNGSFGDVNGDTVSNIADVFDVVKAFQNDQLKPRTWLALSPSGAGSPGVGTGAIGFGDILNAVKGFQQNVWLDIAGAQAPGDCN